MVMTMRYKRLCLFAVLFPIMAWAVVFGTLRGVVHDPDHRPVQKAQVVVKSSSSDYSQKPHSNADGAFEATSLPVGSYVVTVTAEGFAPSRSRLSSLPAARPYCISSLRSGQDASKSPSQNPL